MKVNMTHNENIKTFAGITCHLELEDDHLKVAKPNAHAYLVELSSKKASRFMRNRFNNNWKGKGKMSETGHGLK